MISMRHIFLATVSGCLLLGCMSNDKPDATIEAKAETTPVASLDDAADDPAIWVHPETPEKSIIIGTDKKAGLNLYNLQGEQIQFLPAGELNNVDLRQNISIGDWRGDLIAASNRTDNSISLFEMTAEGVVALGAFPSKFDEPYGLCMGVLDGAPLVFVNHKSGDLIAYKVTGPDNAEEVGDLKLVSQLEGCVFDDKAKTLFVGEEAVGIWKSQFSFRDGFTSSVVVEVVDGISGMAPDVEGLTLYKTGAATGYLIASSQGNNSYAVFNRQPPHAFVTRFAIGDGALIDGTQETDGIAATSANLGAGFPNGMLVVQDGINEPAGQAQNFKIIDWRTVADVINEASE